MDYFSSLHLSSAVIPGVQLTIRRMSFDGRITLTRYIRELAERVEFLRAGDSAGDQLDAALLSAEIDRAYVLWGLADVRGLELDGVEATPESLVARGPESLFREVLAAVKAECGLSEDERKN